MQTGPRPTFGSAGPTDTHSIRPIVGPRMPINAHYAGQGSPQEGGFGGHTPPQYHTYHVQTQNNMPFTSSYNPNYLPRAGGPGGYYVVPQNVVPQSGAYGNNVVIAPQTGGAHQQPPAQQQQQHNIYAQHGTVHTSQPSHMQPQQSQQTQQQAQQPDQLQKKRPTIKLTDPNTGKDLTGELLAKKNAKTAPKPVVNPEENIKQKTAALFAAQVAKVVAGSAPIADNTKPSTPPPAAEKISTAPIKISTPPPPSEKAKDSPAASKPAADVVAPKPTPVLSAPNPVSVLPSHPNESEEASPKVVKSEADVKTTADEEVTDTSDKIVDNVVEETVAVEASPVKL